jgi:UDP:flavonoid glycosyltransferase YjiC (YdhE family)
LNQTRAQLGLASVEEFHGGISRELCLVGTFPQLEYPREWPEWVRVVGPMTFEVPYEEVEVPEGEGPLVVVAPSTAQDPDGRLVRVALEGLAAEPVRVLATTNRPGEPLPDPPGNAVVVEWMSYSQVMSLAEVVVCHGGHGTVCRALGAGVPVVCCPAVGDMAENGARVAWAGAGLTVPWRLTTPRTVRAVMRRVLAEERFRRRAGEIAAWSRAHDGAAMGAELVEEFR